jgi:hypothetical protein
LGVSSTGYGTLSDSLTCTFIDGAHGMGGKSSNYLQSDRPESGGADKDMQREKSGLPDREKEQFAREQAERQASAREASEKKAGYSIENEPNNEPNPESREG